jgi:two-component system chemotaxis sensor kinase CheA
MDSSLGSWDVFTNHGHYMQRIHCMLKADGTPDWPWIIAYVGLTIGVIASYLKIYHFWLKSYFAEQKQHRNRKLLELGNVFLICAATGYLFNIVMFVWPAYRLMVGLLVCLNLASILFLRNLDDFRLAFSAKRLDANNRELEELVRERTGHLEAKTDALHQRNTDIQLLLDNAGQGFLTLNLKGQVDDQRSAVVDRWLPGFAPGRSFHEILAQLDPRAAEWFALSFRELTAGILPLELCIEQLPSQFRLRDCTWALAYRPLLRANELDRLMVIITDISANVERERIEREQKEIYHVIECVLHDRDGFEEFCAETSIILEELGRDPLDIQQVKRQVHTLKGNAGIFGLDSISGICHDLEQRIGADAPREERGGLVRDIALRWGELQKQLGTLLGESSDNVQIAPLEYRSVLEKVVADVCRFEIAEEMHAWQFEPTHRRLERVAQQARGLAQRLGKPHVRVQSIHGGLRLEGPRWRGFWSALVHVLRNAIDHGVESQEERLQNGKLEAATITIRTVLERGLLVIEVADDGRGIDWQAVRERAQTMGLPICNHQDQVEALFAEGFSTRDHVTMVSGRGMGMSIIREACQSLGGKISVESNPGHGTNVRFEFPPAYMFSPFARKLALNASAQAAARL